MYRSIWCSIAAFIAIIVVIQSTRLVRSYGSFWHQLPLVHRMVYACQLIAIIPRACRGYDPFSFSTEIPYWLSRVSTDFDMVLLYLQVLRLVFSMIVTEYKARGSSRYTALLWTVEVVVGVALTVTVLVTSLLSSLLSPTWVWRACTIVPLPVVNVTMISLCWISTFKLKQYTSRASATFSTNAMTMTFDRRRSGGNQPELQQQQQQHQQQSPRAAANHNHVMRAAAAAAPLSVVVGDTSPAAIQASAPKGSLVVTIVPQDSGRPAAAADSASKSPSSALLRISLYCTIVGVCACVVQTNDLLDELNIKFDRTSQTMAPPGSVSALWLFGAAQMLLLIASAVFLFNTRGVTKKRTSLNNRNQPLVHAQPASNNAPQVVSVGPDSSRRRSDKSGNNNNGSGTGVHGQAASGGGGGAGGSKALGGVRRLRKSDELEAAAGTSLVASDGRTSVGNSSEGGKATSSVGDRSSEALASPRSSLSLASGIGAGVRVGVQLPLLSAAAGVGVVPAAAAGSSTAGRPRPPTEAWM